MQKKSITLLLLIFLAAMTYGCKSKTQANTPPHETVLLQTGKGALLVTFPRRENFAREDWMAQVLLTGASNTSELPRVPMADLQAVLVLNVPPGQYNVIAHSWLRKRETESPYGGSASDVDIQAGQITVLKASYAGSDTYPFAQTPLQFTSIFPWTLDSPQALSIYISDVIGKSAKG